jgi:hypothetical protein
MLHYYYLGVSMPEIACLNCKYAEINRSELSPNNVFVKCNKGNFNGKWKFMKIGRDNHNCPVFEPK